MKTTRHFIWATFIALIAMSCTSAGENDEWIELFNGKDLSKWTANENTGSFKVVDGMIVTNGLRSHLFYTGDGKSPADFTNFELSLDVMTHHLANSGVYFHTALQKEGWPDQGYEVQINSTHHGEGDYKEVKKGGSLYGIRNLYKAYTPDSVWYNLNIKVQGKRIQIRMNDQLVVDYIEPVHPSRQQAKQIISKGTFALQGHDPLSTVYFKNIKVKRLPDATDSSAPNEEVFPRLFNYQKNHVAFIDYSIETGPQFLLDSAMRAFYETGINFGLMVNSDSLENGKEDENLLAHVNKYLAHPVFLGIYRPDLKALDSIPLTTLNQFDYVVGDIRTFKNSEGKTMNVVHEQNIINKKTFMDDYVKAIVEGLDRANVNIISSATRLPTSLSSEFDQLWTKERMLKVIEAAKRNNVAIEVNVTSREPAMEFLKLAKEKGCLFAMGGAYQNSRMNEPTYFYDVIDQCKLEYKDIYIPHNP